MISLKLLRYLEEVARSGSIRKAAARLNISSSAVNRHILALEQQLDTPLFERLPTRMRLTASGEVLIAYAQTVDQAHQRVIGRLRALKGLQQGEIRLVSMEGLVNGPLLQLVDDFVGEHRRMLVRLDFQASSEAIASRVLSGDSVRWSPDFGQAVKLGSPDEKDGPDDGQAEAVWG